MVSGVPENQEARMPRKVIRLLAVLRYGQCTHPAIYQKSDGRWYCTECDQLRA